MTTGMFVLALACGMAGAAVISFGCSTRAVEQLGLQVGGTVHGLGIAAGLLLAGLGLGLIIVQAF